MSQKYLKISRRPSLDPEKDKITADVSGSYAHGGMVGLSNNV